MTTRFPLDVMSGPTRAAWRFAAAAEVAYLIPQGMARFIATAGIDPATAGQGHVTLEIGGMIRSSGKGRLTAASLQWKST